MRAIRVSTAVLLVAGLGGCRDRTTAILTEQRHPAVAEAQDQFTFGGQRIPPFFLTDFCGGESAGDFWSKGMGVRVSAVVSVRGISFRAVP